MNGKGFAFFRWTHIDGWRAECHGGWECKYCRQDWEKLNGR